MERYHVITLSAAPAIGDVRMMGEGHIIAIRADATARRDWSRYWEAIGVAFHNGAKLVRL
jgi:hypothetical protein